MTLQDQYSQIQEGKGNKSHFLKQARHLFPEYVNHYNSFNETVKILKSKNILTENIAGLGMVSSGGRKDWFNVFNESVKAEEKKVSKEVTDDQSHAFDNKDVKNIDNLYGQTFLNGFYTEMQDPKNQGKSVDELKQIVAKNLGKDWNYYAKNAQFGIKGIGYTKEAPGLGEPKEPKGKYKASGYGDIPEKTEKPKSNTKDTLSDKEAKITMPKKVKEMPVAPQNSKGVKKMPLPGKPKTIKLQEGIHDMNILSRPISNPDIKYKERTPEEDDYDLDSESERILRMNYRDQIKDPNITDDELRYILSGEGVKGMGGRPKAIDNILKSRNKNMNKLNMKESNSSEYVVWIQPEGEEKKEYNRAKSKSQAMTIANNFMSRYEDDYNPPEVGIMTAEEWKKENNTGLQESKLRAVIKQLIKEELNMKEIEESGKEAEYHAKTKKISEEIMKRKKKLKALTTLEEMEKGSTNKDMLKSLKKEIKTLENLKMKLDKKYSPKEEVIGEEEAAPVPVRESLNEGYGMSLKDAKEEAQRVSKEEGVVQHVEETEEGSGKYRVSDWYDSDLTVVSYQNGMEL